MTGNAMARLRAFWGTTQGKVAIIGSGAGVAGLLGLRARAKKAAGGGIAPAVATTPPAGDTSYAGGQASGPLGPPGFGSNFLPGTSMVGAGARTISSPIGPDRAVTPVTDWGGPNLYQPDVTSGAPAPSIPAISAPPAASAPAPANPVVNLPPMFNPSPANPVTASPIASTQRFTSPYQVAVPTSAYYTTVTPAAPPAAPAPVAPNPVRVIPPPTAAPVYRSLTTPTSNVTRAPIASPAPPARPGPGPPLKGGPR